MIACRSCASSYFPKTHLLTIFKMHAVETPNPKRRFGVTPNIPLINMDQCAYCSKPAVANCFVCSQDICEKHLKHVYHLRHFRCLRCAPQGYFSRWGFIMNLLFVCCICLRKCRAMVAVTNVTLSNLFMGALRRIPFFYTE